MYLATELETRRASSRLNFAKAQRLLAGMNGNFDFFLKILIFLKILTTFDNFDNFNNFGQF